MTLQGRIPRGWTLTSLGELGEYSNGRGFKKSEWSDTGRMIIRIQDLTGSGDNPHYFAGEVDERHVVKPGDLLVSWAATLEAFVWRGPEAVLNQHIFRCRSQIEPTFHYYLLKQAMTRLRLRAHGSGMVHVTKKQFDSLPVFLPPDATQRSIADVIDEQMSRIQAARQAMANADRRLATYRRAVLGRAFNLARHAPEAHGPEGYMARLSDLAITSDYGTSQKADRHAGGLPVVRIPNVVGGVLDLRDMKFLPRVVAPQETKRLRPGDFLVVRTNGSRSLIGRAALVEQELEPAHHHASYLIRFRLKGDLSTWRWVRLMWETPQVRSVIERAAASSAGQYNLSLGWLETVQLPMPPPAVRAEIAADAEWGLSVVSELEQQLRANVLRAHVLESSLLDAAFSGRLEMPA